MPGVAAARVGRGGREGEAGTSEGAQRRERLSPKAGAGGDLKVKQTVAEGLWAGE